MQGLERETPEQTFAARVRELRESAKISQTSVSANLALKGVKIDATSITRLEKGARGIRLNEAAALAQMFDLSIDEMLRPALPPDEQINQAERQAELARWRAAQAVAEMQVSQERLQRLRENLDAELGQLKREFYKGDG